MRKYLIETHMHTGNTSPCGKVDAREAIRIYHKLGYDAVCVTDHFYGKFFDKLNGLTWKDKVDAYLDGYRNAKDEGEKLGIQIILGMEYCIPETRNDFLIYGFDEEFLYNHTDMYLLNIVDIKNLCTKNDLLIIQAHPFRTMVSGTYDEIVEGYEGYNGHPRHENRNELAFEHALNFGGIIISGSDFHQAVDAGTGGIYLPELPKNSRELADLIRKAKTPELIMDESFKERFNLNIS